MEAFRADGAYLGSYLKSRRAKISNPTQVMLHCLMIKLKKKNNIFTSCCNNRTILLNIWMYLFYTKHSNISSSSLPKATTLEPHV